MVKKSSIKYYFICIVLLLVCTISIPNNLMAASSINALDNWFTPSTSEANVWIPKTSGNRYWFCKDGSRLVLAKDNISQKYYFLHISNEQKLLWCKEWPHSDTNIGYIYPETIWASFTAPSSYVYDPFESNDIKLYCFERDSNNYLRPTKYILNINTGNISKIQWQGVPLDAGNTLSSYPHYLDLASFFETDKGLFVGYRYDAWDDDLDSFIHPRYKLNDDGTQQEVTGYYYANSLAYNITELTHEFSGSAKMYYRYNLGDTSDYSIFYNSKLLLNYKPQATPDYLQSSYQNSDVYTYLSNFTHNNGFGAEEDSYTYNNILQAITVYKNGEYLNSTYLYPESTPTADGIGKNLYPTNRTKNMYECCLNNRGEFIYQVWDVPSVIDGKIEVAWFDKELNSYDRKLFNINELSAREKAAWQTSSYSHANTDIRTFNKGIKGQAGTTPMKYYISDRTFYVSTTLGALDFNVYSYSTKPIASLNDDVIAVGDNTNFTITGTASDTNDSSKPVTVTVMINNISKKTTAIGTYSITFNSAELGEGNHDITVKVTDNYNISTSSTKKNMVDIKYSLSNFLNSIDILPSQSQVSRIIVFDTDNRIIDYNTQNLSLTDSIALKVNNKGLGLYIIDSGNEILKSLSSQIK